MANNHSGAILAAMLGGAVIGAAAALLLAPKSGAELRKEIIDLAREKGAHLNREEMEQFVQDVLSKLRARCSSIEEAIEETLKENDNENVNE